MDQDRRRLRAMAQWGGVVLFLALVTGVLVFLGVLPLYSFMPGSRR